MRYITIFDTTDQLSKIEITKEWDEWINKCRDEMFHHGCKDIERYETRGSEPTKLFFIIEADNPSVIDRLRDHFGPHWRFESYPVHYVPGLRDDHAVVAG